MIQFRYGGVLSSLLPFFLEGEKRGKGEVVYLQQ
jgi:hypothetical protein